MEIRRTDTEVTAASLAAVAVDNGRAVAAVVAGVEAVAVAAEVVAAGDREITRRVLHASIP